MRNFSKASAVLATTVFVATGFSTTNAFTPLAHHLNSAGLLQQLRSTSPPSYKNFPRLQAWKDDQDNHDELEATNSNPNTNDSSMHKKKKSSTDPTPIAWSFIQDNLQATKASLAAALLVVMLTLSPLMASAAMSGGRMGGSFSAPRQSTGRALSSPSYGGGGGGSYYGGGYYGRPNIIVAPTISPFYSPFYSPFGYGGAGVVTYGGGGGGFGLLFALGFGAFALMSILPAIMAPARLASSAASSLFDGPQTTALGPGTSVVQVSVALQVPNRDDPNSILSILNRLSQSARTDSRVGIQNLASQVALELLRRKSSITAASASYKHFNSRDKAQREFNQLSIKERSKFEQETVSKYGGVDYASSSSRSLQNLQPLASSSATMAVVTLVLAIDGDSTKVSSNSMTQVEEALRRIASDAKVDDCLQSIEILWTPEDRSETLTARDVVADYPELRTL